SVQPKKAAEFDTKKIAIVFSVILLLALIILYFSGVFDEPKISSENFQPVNQTQGSGIDLASIDRINQIDAQLKSEPNNFELILQLAHLKNDSGFKEDAIKLYKKYLEKFPDNTDVLVDMGVCYFDLKNYDEAIPAMEKAIKINPKHQIANMNLGIVNLAKGNIEKSKEWLQKAVALDPNSEIGRKAKELLTSH
ncbi:MAG: tetratricopeptide repeat protein, partial [Ignavibacteria bacterium]|nr:tetratricopeptide repeat protein [Ignavibacteria bacterium]